MRPNTYTYPAIFAKESDSSYSVRFPQLDGCFTQGDTMDDALRMAEDAMALHLFGMEEDGEDIPEAVFDNIATEEGEIVVRVVAWMTPFRDEMYNRAVKKTLSIPAWLNAEAEKRNVNFSHVLQAALKDHLRIYHP